MIVIMCVLVFLLTKLCFFFFLSPWWQFLSMKLASVNTRMDLSIESLVTKDVSFIALDKYYIMVYLFFSPQKICCFLVFFKKIPEMGFIVFWWFQVFQSNNSLATLPNAVFPLDSSAQTFYGHQPQQNNPVAHNNIPNRSVTHCSVDPLDTSLCQNLAMQLPPLNVFNDGGSQVIISFFYFSLQINKERKKVHYITRIFLFLILNIFLKYSVSRDIQSHIIMYV